MQVEVTWHEDWIANIARVIAERLQDERRILFCVKRRQNTVIRIIEEEISLREKGFVKD